MSYIYPAVGAYGAGNKKYTFTVWAPQRKQIEVIHNESAYPMNRDERGYWSATLDNIRPGDRYLYRLDHEKIFPDPASRWQPDGVHGASAVADTEFAWTDDDWEGLLMSDMIIYELHTGTFTEPGTFDGIVSRLAYLKSLGVNTIEVMPIAQFPGRRNWGYDGVYPFAAHHDYGGVDGFKRLVNEAHRQGIAVILDVVYNHMGPEGNYLREYGPYFTEKYHTPWGSALNFDDAWCDGVRHYFLQNALMWLDEFHVDGLRMDAIHAICDFSANHFIQDLTTAVAGLERDSGRKKVLIAEIDLNNPRYINPPEKGGYGMDGQWVDEFHHALRALVTGETDGYYEDFGKPEHLTKALRDSYVYTGQYSKHRKKQFGVPPRDNDYSQFVVFGQNHDQVGNRLLGDRLTGKISFEALKLVAATVLLSPHVPMLFMGEEYGEKNPFQYFISHTDDKLVELVRKGRRDEFHYFNWKGDVPDPQSEEVFRQCILSGPDPEDPEQNVLQQWYTFLIRFRKERLAMKGRERDSLQAFDPTEDGVVSFIRSSGSDKVLVVLNFSKQPASYTPPLFPAIRKVFDSSASQWQGPGAVTPDVPTPSVSFTINPESVVLFEL